MSMQAWMLYTGGIFTIAIAAMHLVLPLLRGWYKEIKLLDRDIRMSIIDRGSFMVLLLVIIAFATFVVNEDFRVSDTGRTFLTLIGVFWIVRGVWRYTGYTKNKAAVTLALFYLVTGICYLLALVPGGR